MAWRGVAWLVIGVLVFHVVLSLSFFLFGRVPGSRDKDAPWKGLFVVEASEGWDDG